MGLSKLNGELTVTWTNTDRAGRSSFVHIVHRARSRSPRRQVGESPVPQAAAEPPAESPEDPPTASESDPLIQAEPPVSESYPWWVQANKSYPGWVQVNTGGNMERVFVQTGSVIWGDWKDKQWLFHATPTRHPCDWEDMGPHPGLQI